MSAFSIRPIRREDDARVAEIIRTVMPQFGACGEGFAISDPEVDHMSVAYGAPRHAYFVVERDGQVVGGGGVGQLVGGGEEVCELRKMYFLEEARGHGVGAQLLTRCLETAKAFGYRSCYLETLNSMKAAQRLYERLGFQKISGPLGKTGHFGCDTFYSRPL